MRLCERARNIIGIPETPRSEIVIALDWARKAEEMAPDYQYCKAMIGAGQFRLGQHTEALNTLVKATGPWKHQALLQAWAFKAMAHYRLGQMNEARAALATVDEHLDDPDLGKAGDDLRIAAEARRLILGRDEGQPTTDPIP